MPEDKTMSELVEEELASPGSALAAPGSAYDYALPQGWVDHVKKITGQYPMGFVWHYPPRDQPGHIWGVPFALTEEASILLADYEEATL